MNLKYISSVLFSAILFAAICCANVASADSGQQIVRIVTYNIQADLIATPSTPAITTPLPGLIQPADSFGNYTGSVTDGGVLEGTGEEPLGANHHVQPLDILALQETTSNSITVDPIVSGLNSYYGVPGMYAQSPFQATLSSPSLTGNGPNAIVYNTHTVQLVDSVAINNTSSTGAPRQVMRYEFAPAGVAPTPDNEFYIYVSHYKSGDAISGTGTSNVGYRRAVEATAIRADEATLPSDARVLYVGDYNIGGSSEDAYQIITEDTVPGISSQGQGIDPLNPSGSAGIDWAINSLLDEKTESVSSLRYRDDIMTMTSNVYAGLMPGTYHVFGNNGTIAYLGDARSSTALDDVVADGGTFISASDLRNDLRWASDHYPVVADFLIPVPEPSSLLLVAVGGSLLMLRRAKALRTF